MLPSRHRRDADSNGTAATPSTRLNRRAGCADKACDDAPDKEECDRKKSMMQLMQSMDQGACKRHTDGQVAACKCVKPDEAPARRLKTIKEVYEKNGGDLCGNQPVCVGCYLGDDAAVLAPNALKF